jgi:hypothetical protein
MKGIKLSTYHHQLNQLFNIICKDEIFLNAENEKMFNELFSLENKFYKLFYKDAMGKIENEKAEIEYKRLKNKLDKISKALKFEYYIQGDLRGYIVRISKEKIDGKNYDTKSFPVGALNSIK